MMKPIDLYVAPPSPPCRAVILAAKYMNINVKLIQIDLMKGEQKEDWFVKMNPQHCLPTINDNGFILWESRAIMSYFANKYAPNDPIYPSDPKKRGIVDRLMQYDLNVLCRSLSDFLIPVAREGKTTKFLNTIKERKVIEALSYLDSVLSVNNFVASDHLTLADFSIYCSLEFAKHFNYNLSKYKNINQYYNRLEKVLNQMNQMNQTIPNYDYLNENYHYYLSLLHQQNKPEPQSNDNFIIIQDQNDQSFFPQQPEPDNLYLMLNSSPSQQQYSNNNCNDADNEKQKQQQQTYRSNKDNNGGNQKCFQGCCSNTNSICFC